MKTAHDERLQSEIERFALRFTCDDCVHFEMERQACIHGYPTRPHRLPLVGGEVVFCKEFELA